MGALCQSNSCPPVVLGPVPNVATAFTLLMKYIHSLQSIKILRSNYDIFKCSVTKLTNDKCHSLPSDKLTSACKMTNNCSFVILINFKFRDVNFIYKLEK